MTGEVAVQTALWPDGQPSRRRPRRRPRRDDTWLVAARRLSLQAREAVFQLREVLYVGLDPRLGKGERTLPDLARHAKEIDAAMAYVAILDERLWEVSS